MNIETVLHNGVPLAVVSGGEKVITDVSSAMDLALSVRYETGANRLVLPKRLVAEDFFILSTGLAGEILQKWINYQFKAAFWGDYSRYTSKPLHDFMGESNRGGNFFFVSTQEEAMDRLAGA